MIDVIETEIKKFYSVSSVYNSYLEINKELLDTLNRIKASKLNGTELDENSLWNNFNETDLINQNEIRDFYPEITEFYMKHNLPFMKKFQTEIGLMPNGQINQRPNFDNGAYLLLLNEICAFDLTDDDLVRNRINEIMIQLDQKTSGRLSQIQRNKNK